MAIRTSRRRCRAAGDRLIGLKIHEDWGIDAGDHRRLPAVADEHDFQVQIHTDTLNESGFVEDTLAAIGGRTIHMYHTEGAGGGHAPDIIRVAGDRIACRRRPIPPIPTR